MSYPILLKYLQVTPQLLSIVSLGTDLEVGGLDWGSLYIYTCDK